MGNNIEKLTRGLPADMDGALITSDINRRYFTGFNSSSGTLLATREKSYLLIDSRYFEAAKPAAKGCEVILQEKLFDQLKELIERHGLKSLGIESETVSMSAYMRYKDMLPLTEVLSDNRLSDMINSCRRIKEPWEIENIIAAQKISDKTFAYVCGIIRAGMTEREIALEMEFYSRREGSEELAFPFIVGAGANGSLPHAVPSDYRVRQGDLIVLDFGSTVNGYRSDMTRTVAMGTPGSKQREVYEIVLAAQLAALGKIRPGVSCGKVDKAARDIIDGSAYKGLFGHGLGHSLGLEVHESPRFGPEAKAVLEAGTVMSVEPGVYIPGEFGVRIEDIVVAAEGGYQNLVSSPKELIVL